MKSIKVTEDVHEGLKIMAAIERRTLFELVNEELTKLILPFKGIKYVKRTKSKDER